MTLEEIYKDFPSDYKDGEDDDWSNPTSDGEFTEVIVHGYMKFLEDNQKEWCTKNGFKFIVQEGGGEGGTEYCYSVFEFKGQLYKFEYSYYSHEGYDFDNAELSKTSAQQKVVTVYV